MGVQVDSCLKYTGGGGGRRSPWAQAPKTLRQRDSHTSRRRHAHENSIHGARARARNRIRTGTGAESATPRVRRPTFRTTDTRSIASRSLSHELMPITGLHAGALEQTPQTCRVAQHKPLVASNATTLARHLDLAPVTRARGYCQNHRGLIGRHVQFRSSASTSERKPSCPGECTAMRGQLHLGQHDPLRATSMLGGNTPVAPRPKTPPKTRYTRRALLANHLGFELCNKKLAEAIEGGDTHNKCEDGNKCVCVCVCANVLVSCSGIALITHAYDSRPDDAGKILPPGCTPQRLQA